MYKLVFQIETDNKREEKVIEEFENTPLLFNTLLEAEKYHNKWFSIKSWSPTYNEQASKYRIIIKQVNDIDNYHLNEKERQKND